MENYILHVQEPVNLTIYLYAQTMGQRRMLYIRKFYAVKNIYIYMDNYMLHVQESVNLTIYLYAQTKGHRRMLYIRKFYVVKNIYILTRAGVLGWLRLHMTSFIST